MASRYSKVQSTIWGSKKLKSVDDSAKLAYMYLLSCPHGNSAGIFILPIGYALTDLDWTDVKYKSAMGVLEEAELIACDGDIVFIKQFLRFNPYNNMNHAKGSFNEISGFIGSHLYGLFYEDLYTYCEKYIDEFPEPIDGIETVSKRYRNGIETVSVPRPDHNQDHNHNHNNAQALDASPLEKAIADFKAHRKALKRTMTPKAVELMLAKLNRLAQTDEDKIAILNQSIECGWIGVFEIKDNARASPLNKKEAPDQYQFS